MLTKHHHHASKLILCISTRPEKPVAGSLFCYSLDKFLAATREDSYPWLGIAKYWTEQEHMRSHQEAQMMQHPEHSALGLYRAFWESSGDGDHAPQSGLPCLLILQSNSASALLRGQYVTFFHALICSKEVISHGSLLSEFLGKITFMATCVCFRKYFMLLQYLCNTSF